MNFQNASILSTSQFAPQDLTRLFDVADQMSDIYKQKIPSTLLSGKIMATIFFEPSTRTRFSFETAMLRLGGQVVSNADMLGSSSIKKQESLYDTGRTLSQLADVIVMRHPQSGAVEELRRGSTVPVLNAGDGPSSHPTQGLLDVYTIHKYFGKLEKLTIGMVGDLRHSRVVHSQCKLLKHFGAKFILISPPELKMPEDIKKIITDQGGSFEEHENLTDVISQLDVLSNTRIQEERFPNPLEYQKFRGIYQIDNELLKKAKEKMIIIDPLPRVASLNPEIDKDPRAKYFEQVANGVKIRMALLALIFGKA